MSGLSGLQFRHSFKYVATYEVYYEVYTFKHKSNVIWLLDMAKHDMNPVNSSSPESGATVRGGGTRTSEDQVQNGAGGGKGPGNHNFSIYMYFLN